MEKHHYYRIADFKTYLETGCTMIDENGIPFRPEQNESSETLEHQENISSPKSQKPPTITNK